MENVIAITKKELKSYFNSPIAFMTIAVFLILSTWLFFYYGEAPFFTRQISDIRSLFIFSSYILLFIAPAISMRLISEEKYNGTLELLVTMPIDDWEIIVGKYIATLIMYAFILVGLAITPITVMIIGDPEFGVIVTSYVGFFFLGAAYLSIGLAASAFTKNQIVAFISTFIFLGILFFIGESVTTTGTAAVIVDTISIHKHFNNFFRGIIDARDIIYFLSIIVLSLAIASSALSSRKYVK